MPSRQHSISHNSPEDFPESNTQYTESIALAMIDACQHWWALQLEAMEKALSENVQHSRSLIEHAAATTDVLAQWSDLVENKNRRYADLTSSGLEIATQTFTQIKQLMDPRILSFTSPTLPETTRQSVSVERRVSAQVISFPDRRKASGMAGHSQSSARKRKAA